MKFFNREKEINKILSIIEGEPNLIYFIYGSLNSGKFNLTE
ncbi:TPA: ATP-binding protein, partial [Methanocaldococcus jannaschii]|nr:ATP-binding protein [Methanocaldococcus jannaschii]